MLFDLISRQHVAREQSDQRRDDVDHSMNIYYGEEK